MNTIQLYSEYIVWAQISYDSSVSSLVARSHSLAAHIGYLPVHTRWHNPIGIPTISFHLGFHQNVYICDTSNSGSLVVVSVRTDHSTGLRNICGAKSRLLHCRLDPQTEWQNFLLREFVQGTEDATFLCKFPDSENVCPGLDLFLATAILVRV